MVRKFKLINSRGSEWDLMRKDGFLFEPDGLGLGKNNEYMRAGSTYELIEEVPAQKSVSFTMVFSSYSVYSAFADFIVFAPLKLAYMPGSEWAYLDGNITAVSKSEIDKNNRRLLCSCTFTATSLWYIPRAARKTSDDVAYPKKYTYSYATDNDDSYTYADEINGYITVYNNASEDSPATISIMGPITDPAWYVSVNNEVIASGAVTADIPSGDKLVINSKDGYLEVAEYVASTDTFVRNLYQATDFGRETFVLFPPGTSSLFISGTTDTSIEAWVEVEEVHDTI